MDFLCEFGFHKWNKGCICQRCLQWRHVWSGGKCTRCGMDIVTHVKERLKMWYRLNSIQRPGGETVGKGYCDDCGRQNLKMGSTYLRPGGYLCCEACTDAFINMENINWDEALLDMNRFFGPGVSALVLHEAAKAKE